MSEQRLHRSLYGRLFGTTLQGILTLFAFSTIALIGVQVYALCVGKHAGALSWWLIPDALLTLLWLRGLTAWATVDDDGVHTRFFLRSDYPWKDMHSVSLQRLGNIASALVPGPAAIVVRMRKPAGDEDKLAAALRCGRGRREFGTAIVATARAHGVEAVVGSKGWHETPERQLDYFEG